MDQSFSRYAITSISLALLIPVEFYAITRGIFAKLPFFLPAMILVGTPLGAIVLGHMARGQVRRSGYIRGGYGTGSTGMVLGYLALSAFSYLAVMFSMTPSRNGVTMDETLALTSLRDVYRSLASYAKLHPDKGFPSSLDELASDAALADANRHQGLELEFELAREERCGYKFTYVSSAQQNGPRRDSFELFADPTRHLWHGRRHFFLNQTGILRDALDRSASARDSESYPLF